MAEWSRVGGDLLRDAPGDPPGRGLPRLPAVVAGRDRPRRRRHLSSSRQTGSRRLDRHHPMRVRDLTPVCRECGVKRTGVVVLLVLATLLWTVGIVAVWAQRQLLDTQNWVRRATACSRTSRSARRCRRPSCSGSTPARRSRPSCARRSRQPAAARGPDRRGAARGRQPQRPEGARDRRRADGVGEGQPHRPPQLAQGPQRRRPRGGTVTLNLHDLIAQVAAGTGLPAGVADRLPQNLQQLQVLKTDKIEAAQKTLQTAKKLVIVLVVLAVLLMAGAIALSTDRRRTVVACGGCILFAGVAVLALRRSAARPRSTRSPRRPTPARRSRPHS